MPDDNRQKQANPENIRASDPGGVRPAGLTAEALRADHDRATADDADTDDEAAAGVRARVEAIVSQHPG